MFVFYSYFCFFFFGRFSVHLILSKDFTISHLYPLMSVSIYQALSETPSRSLRSFAVWQNFQCSNYLFHNWLNGSSATQIHICICNFSSSLVDLTVFLVFVLPSFGVCRIFINKTTVELQNKIYEFDKFNTQFEIVSWLSYHNWTSVKNWMPVKLQSGTGGKQRPLHLFL